ncbi:ubiquitin carboxyl-terminal hydrolase 10 isoform X2 [Pseudophryne corroboree]|uniref:ubiquitin carboxyl-terminal hydrolase 10 isoform X2 n=1 Tax=Pseudophryne corroboree TaxID=495146 RepID=UPI0030812FF5
MRSALERGERRWRRRGKQHERPHSLKVSAMASPSAQYIFGEFSDDEFKQFFVSARCTVELPPFNESGFCGPQSSSDLQDVSRLLFTTVSLSWHDQRQGDEYQRIEFGVSEVIDTDAVLLNSSDYSISSNLNPQAPEFILACTPTQKTPDCILNEDDCNANDGQYSESALPDGSGNADSDSTSGIGQRERKKKKKRPPGYYSYLEGGGDGIAPIEALVNGHANVAGLDSISTDEPELADDPAASASPRTCNSPDHSVDFNSETDDASVSNALDATRTAGQPEECSVTRSPCILSDTGRESPERTAVEQPLADSDTTEILGVTNGQTLETPEEGPSSNGVDLHPEAAATSDQAKPEDTSQPQTVSPVSPSVNPPAKSWASLFHTSKPSPAMPVAYVEAKSAPPATPPQAPEKQVEVREGPVPVSEDPVAIKIAELLEGVKLVHKPVSLQPRGLVNKGNWCYINATLQALVACPPMYHLMKCIPMYTKLQRPCTSTPMIDSFVRLMNEFTNMPVLPKAKQVSCDSLAVPGDKIVRDIRPGAAFEPTYIYRLLTVSKSTLSEKGRQEDAEEYLGFVLNGLHEEMLSLKKLLYPENDKISVSNGPETQPASDEADMNDHDDRGEASDEEWEQVGPRNKSSVTRQADFVQTLITDIFGGHMRSVVYQQSSKESATLQPFFTLQLDIQSEKIRTVQDALEILVARESVQGYTTKTKQEVEISRRVTLEELPPVLVLHLKRFVFEKTGGCQKLVKNVDYPVDLEISKDLLSPGVKSKIFKPQRTYRLFAVVYHHGNSATGGHYTTDVFQIGLNGWLRIDDQNVKVINQYQVVKQTVERTAYLLYYRRVDLL